MAGLLGLVGGDEFHRGNELADARLAAAARGAGPAYTVATAARSHPAMAVRQARSWFLQFGLHLLELPVYTRKQAGDPALAATAADGGFFYIAGGDPGLVASVLRDSPVGTAMVAAWRRGAVLAGSSAGAMALCAHTLVRQSFPGHAERRAVPAMGVVPGSAVLPHHQTFGRGWLPSARLALPDATLIGIDERTCALWESGRWEALGDGAVTVIAPGHDGVAFVSTAIDGLPQPSATPPAPGDGGAT